MRVQRSLLSVRRPPRSRVVTALVATGSSPLTVDVGGARTDFPACIASTAKLCRCAQTSDVRELPEASCRLTAEALVCLLCTNLVYLYQPQHLSMERMQPGDGICHGDNARACDGHTLS